MYQKGKLAARDENVQFWPRNLDIRGQKSIFCFGIANFVNRAYHQYTRGQGGRTWQAFGGGKNGHETFRQARNYNFRNKCVVFARNLKFLNLTQ